MGKAITRKIDQLSAQSVDAILIYIPKEYESLTAYSTEYEKFDLHDYVKAYAAQRQVATQFVRQKTIDSELHCQITDFCYLYSFCSFTITHRTAFFDISFYY